MAGSITAMEMVGCNERRTLLNNIPVLFYSILPPLNTRSFFGSKSIEIITGYDSQEIACDPGFWDSLIGPDDRDQVLSLFAESCGNGESFESQYSIVHKDGSIRYILERFHPVFDQSGQLVRSDGIITDVTYCKMAEEQVKTNISELRAQNKRLEEYVEQANLMAKEALEANEAKSNFLANMSHEIRTPMNSIVGFTDILLDEELSEKHREYVSIIKDAGENLLSLINDILDFSKIESGQFGIEAVECSLGELLGGVEALMRPLAGKKDIEFAVRKKGRLPSNIHSDPVRLRQCLINLINNAIKFTETGHVYLDVCIVEFDGKRSIRFDVEDTGIGIEPGSLDLIFDPFSQADQSTTRRFGGTGLGLAITRKLADMLGGSVFLTSEPGRGSVFSLVIPVKA